MKKCYRISGIFIAAVFIAASLMGCLEVGSTASDVVIKSGARVAGYSLAQKNPALAAVILPQAQTLLAAASGDQTQFVNVLFPAAVALLSQNTNDPLIAASIADVLSLISVDATVPIKAGFMKAAVQGFAEGLTLAGVATAKGK